MPGVFHTTYSDRTLGVGVKCQVCFTQHTQVAPLVWVRKCQVFHTTYSGRIAAGMHRRVNVPD